MLKFMLGDCLKAVFQESEVLRVDIADIGKAELTSAELEGCDGVGEGKGRGAIFGVSVSSSAMTGFGSSPAGSSK